MQLEQELEGPFHYSLFGPLFFTVVVLLILLYIFYRLLRRYIETMPKPVIKTPPLNIYQVKNKYLKEIDVLEKKVEDNKITIRRAYNELSRIIRRFVFSATGIDAIKFSLKDIKALNHEHLTLLMEEYYRPEFSKEGKGDIEQSIKRTRGVIRVWK